MRKDPEKFLSRSSNGFAIERRVEIIVKKPNGETIKCGDVKCELLDKKGKVLQTALRSAKENLGISAMIAKWFDYLGIGMGTAGAIAGSGWPATLNNWTHPGQRKFAEGEISGAVYNYASKVINPKGVDRKGQFISNPFAEALSERSNPDIKKMTLLELFDELFK